jgi:hypothetical protein
MVWELELVLEQALVMVLELELVLELQWVQHEEEFPLVWAWGQELVLGVLKELWMELAQVGEPLVLVGLLVWGLFQAWV